MSLGAASPCVWRGHGRPKHQVLEHFDGCIATECSHRVPGRLKAYDAQILDINIIGVWTIVVADGERITVVPWIFPERALSLELPTHDPHQRIHWTYGTGLAYGYVPRWDVRSFSRCRRNVAILECLCIAQDVISAAFWQFCSPILSRNALEAFK